MAGVLSASVASKVLPLEGLIDEDGATDGPFVFQPPEGADLLDELHLDKETFFLLIGALTQSNTLDANMALGVLCKEHLDKPALETLCVRLFAALKQLESEKEKKSRRSGLSSRNSLTVDKRLSNTSSAREDGEKVNVWDRLSRPVGATPRDSDEYAAKLAELSSTMPPPQVVEEEEPRKVLVKSESEAKVIFNRLYCDAARWKVRKRVYTELALMAEDAKVAKECPFQPTIRKTKKDDASDTTQPSASQRLYEESKSRSSRRQDLCINAPTPSFQPETSRSARDRLSASGEEFHLRLHKDATKYREMRQNLNDYQLAVCTFRPDTAQSHRSGPKVNTIPIWRRSISKPEAKIESKQPKHVPTRRVSNGSRKELRERDKQTESSVCLSERPDISDTDYESSRDRNAKISSGNTSVRNEPRTDSRDDPTSSASNLCANPSASVLSTVQDVPASPQQPHRITQSPRLMSNATSGVLNKSSDKLEEQKLFSTQRQLSYRLAQPPDPRTIQGHLTPLASPVAFAGTPTAGWGSAVDVRLAPNPVNPTQYVSRPQVTGLMYR